VTTLNLRESQALGTAVISRAEVAAALAKAALAASLAWEHGLSGYDAIHLASALAWSEALGETVAVAAYDRELWRGAKASGLSAWPAAM
jgi:hypothetical protein